jgi:16S rRNA (guanine527-N7)-methyltransferase
MNERFIVMLDDVNITITKQQLDQFERYFQELITWNNKLNLTSITEQYEVYLKHFFDSICLVKAVKLKNQTLLDVGSGAGFPSIPLKIMFPSLQITILDALKKRIDFLQELSDKLEIDVTLMHGRAEEYDQREQYDIVTARAVANLQILSELCLPFVKVNGLFLAMKGPNYQTEIDASHHALKELNGNVEEIITYPIEELDRTIIKIRKQKETPTKYPRRYKKIKSKPL